MQRSDRSPGLRRWRFSFLAWLALVLAVGLGPGAASAQEGADTSAADQFGGFSELARSNGFQLTYDSPGTFPFSPVIQISVPEAITTLTTGPAGFARSSVAYPGDVLANLPSVINNSGNESPEFLEPYDVKAEAFSPAGPFEAQQTQGPAVQEARASGVTSFAKTSFSGLAAAPVATAGSVVSTSETTIEGTQIVARTRTVVSDLILAGGIVTIDSVTTDLVGTSNGETAATSGDTLVSGVKFLGLDAEIDEDGFRVVESPPDPADPTGGPLGPLGEVLDPVTTPFNDLVASLNGPRDEALTELFNQSGFRIRVGTPDEVITGAFGERIVEGLLFESNYDGSTAPVISTLLAAVPSDSLPAEGLPGTPINTSPQALFNLMKETHIETIAIGPGIVSVNATPAFVFELPEFTPVDTPATTGASPSFDVPQPSSSGTFSSPTPALPAPSAELTPTQRAALPLQGRPILALGAALPAFAIIFLALASPFFAIGSRRLADNVLEGVSSSCPDGLDKPLKGDA